MSSVSIASEHIKVFPFGKTRSSDPFSRALNEQNLTTLIKLLTDTKSYVASWDEENEIIEFVIEGYYFKAEMQELLKSAFVNVDPDDATKDPILQPVYAYIELYSDNDKYYYLMGGDAADSTFDAVKFTSQEPEGSHKLKLLEVKDNKYNVPESSTVKFDISSVLGNIDLDKYATKEDTAELQQTQRHLEVKVNTLIANDSNQDTRIDAAEENIESIGTDIESIKDDVNQLLGTDDANTNTISTYYDVIYCGSSTEII